MTNKEENQQYGKGSYMEEASRHYFIRNGHFVIRGGGLRHQSLDVTDIDIWAYSKSGIDRTISIIDIKNRQKPAAFERILWVKGVLDFLKADKAAIVTTDQRSEIVEFAEKLSIRVITTQFINNWSIHNRATAIVLSEEQISNFVRSYKFYKPDGNWLDRLEDMKSSTISNLGFSSALSSLEHARFFIHKAVENGGDNSLAMRLFFRAVAYFCISIDHAIAKNSHDTEMSLSLFLTNGLTYGPKGKRGLDDSLGSMHNLISHFSPSDAYIFKDMRQKVYNSLSNDRISGVAEIISKPRVRSSLFRVAQILDNMSRLEQFSYSVDVLEIAMIIYALADYWEIERERITLSLNAEDRAFSN